MLFNDSPSIPGHTPLIEWDKLSREPSAGRNWQEMAMSYLKPLSWYLPEDRQIPRNTFDTKGHFLREDVSNKRQQWQPLTKDQVMTPYRGTDLKLHAFEIYISVKVNHTLQPPLPGTHRLGPRTGQRAVEYRKLQHCNQQTFKPGC